MPYTVWMDGQKIGETTLEARHGPRRRAGVFHPTEFGLSVLPGITAMAPALLDTGRMCRDHGIDTEVDDLDDAVMETIFDSPEGQRIVAAARHISKLQLRSPSGELILWDAILISDFHELAELAQKYAGEDAADSEDPEDEDTLALAGLEPVRYLISATFDEDRSLAVTALA
jgi:hypothetical protein